MVFILNLYDQLFSSFEITKINVMLHVVAALAAE